MIRDLVSILIPVFNRPAALDEAVASALAQTWRPIEILVIDDGSSDETPEVAARLAREQPDLIRVLRRSNGGPGLARETGRQAARGEFLQYLDSDDLLAPGKLELQVAALRADPACEIAYCICRETELDGSERNPVLRPSNRPIASMFPTFLEMRWWNTLTPLYRAELCARAGAWSGLRLEEDWEYDARLAALGPRLAFVPEPLAVHRNLGGPRLSGGDALDPARLRDRAAAHSSIFESALRAAVKPDQPERALFARSLFLLARRCGAVGQLDEARGLLRLAREASTPERARGWDFRLVAALARTIGWRATGRLSLQLDRLRKA